MANLSTTWTARDYGVAFNQGTLANQAAILGQVEDNLHRGTLSASTSPTNTQVNNWIVRAKQELLERFGFTWRRAYAYASLAAGTAQYGLPTDFIGGGGETRLRNTTDDAIITYVDNVTFDYEFPDPLGTNNASPEYYTIKDRELWLSSPSDGTYTVELEYNRSGDDSTASDISYIPEVFRFKLADRVTFLAFRFLQMWEAAAMYKVDWEEGVERGKKQDARGKWAAMGYMMKHWSYKK
jgi:hypothetical protein